MPSPGGGQVTPSNPWQTPYGTGGPPQGAFGQPYGYGPPAWSAGAALYLDSVLRQPLAPWWKRLLAALLDGVIVGGAYFVAIIAIAIAASHPTSTAPTTNTLPNPGAVLGGLLFLWIIALIPATVYFAAMNGSRRGQTVGKMALGIAVRDARFGTPIGFWRGVGRYLITALFGILLYIPYILDSLWPLWDQRRQSWHDKVVSSVVIDLKP